MRSVFVRNRLAIGQQRLFLGGVIDGEMYSERREAELEAFPGNRYPASDIPQIARRLYMQRG